jgi:hypothetical protein
VIVLPILAFTGIACLIARHSPLPFRYSLAATVALISVSGSVASAGGVLYEHTLLLAFLGVSGLIAEIVMRMILLRPTLNRQNGQVLGYVSIKEVLLLTLILAFLVTKLGNQTFVTWDDFSHWGVFSRDFINGNGEWVAAYQNTVYRNYPPGLSPLQYLFGLDIKSGLNLKFSESSVLLANAIAAVAFFFPLLALAQSKSNLIAFWVALLGLLIVFAPGNGFRTLMVDHQLALAFGFCLVALLDKQLCSSTARYGLVGMVLGYIFLLKPSGAFLAGLCLVLGLRQIFSRSFPIDSLRVVAAGLLLLPLVASVVLWNVGKAELGDGAFGSSSYSTLDALMKFISNEEPVRSIRTHFLQKLSPLWFHEGQGLVFNKTAGALFLLSVWFFCLHRLRKFDRTDQWILGFLISGLVLHTGGLLWLYINSFSMGEALVAHSFDRYMGQYIIAPHMLALLWFLGASPSQLTRRSKWFLGILLTLSVISFADGKGLGFAFEKNKSLQQRTESPALSDSVGKSSDSVVLAFWNCPSGMEYLVLRYDLHPTVVKPVQFSRVGCVKGAMDPHKPLTDPSVSGEIRSEIKARLVNDKENYLYIGRGSQHLRDALGLLSHSDVNERLYRLRIGNTGDLIFTPMGSLPD